MNDKKIKSAYYGFMLPAPLYAFLFWITEMPRLVFHLPNKYSPAFIIIACVFGFLLSLFITVSIVYHIEKRG